ncbi:MAG: tRNA lysidine(34) synthetase [bacterium]
MTAEKESKRFLNMHKKLEVAVADYNMITEGDHILVALSGGKDSSVMLKLLARKKVSTTNDYKLSSVFVKTGFEKDVEIEKYLQEYSESLKVPFYSVETPFSPLTNSKAKKPCYLCSRFRRLAIFDLADKVGSSVVAFGHHRDDFIQTFFLNIFSSGLLQSIYPVHSFFKGKYKVIRPMLYIDERALSLESKVLKIEAFESGCPFGAASERAFIKSLLQEIEKRNPDAVKNAFKAICSEKPDLLKPPLKKLKI